MHKKNAKGIQSQILSSICILHAYCPHHWWVCLNSCVLWFAPWLHLTCYAIVPPHTKFCLVTFYDRELYSNNISGAIPTDLGNLTSLVSLDLYLNSFTGPIPDSLGRLSKLRFLWVFLSFTFVRSVHNGMLMIIMQFVFPISSVLFCTYSFSLLEFEKWWIA